MENAARLRIIVEGVVAGFIHDHLLNPRLTQRAQVGHAVRHKIFLAVRPGLIAVNKHAAVRLIRITENHLKLRKGYGLLWKNPDAHAPLFILRHEGKMLRFKRLLLLRFSTCTVQLAVGDIGELKPAFLHRVISCLVYSTIGSHP